MVSDIQYTPPALHIDLVEHPDSYTVGVDMPYAKHAEIYAAVNDHIIIIKFSGNEHQSAWERTIPISTLLDKNRGNVMFNNGVLDIVVYKMYAW